ncbi:hypothetical protein Tco_0609188 [Tanacetum coccineum]
METKDTSSLCLDFEELDLKELQKKARLSKEGSMNGFRALHLTFKLLLGKDISAWSADGFEDVFIHLFGEKVSTYKRTFSQNMDILEKQLTKETLHENDCKTALKELKTIFTKVFKSELINPSNFNSSYYRKHFEIYIVFEAHLFKYTMISNMDFIEKYMIETILHEQEIQKQLNEKKMQPQEVQIITIKELNANSVFIENSNYGNERISSFKRRLKGTRIEHGFKQAFLSLFGQKIETFTALDAGLVVIESSGTESRKQDTSIRSGNDTNVDDADIIPVYDKEPMVEVQPTAEYDLFVNEQQHVGQSEPIYDTYVLENLIAISLLIHQI